MEKNGHTVCISKVATTLNQLKKTSVKANGEGAYFLKTLVSVRKSILKYPPTLGDLWFCCC